MKTAVVIMAGGFGSRLWPLSRKKFPKQFASIINEKSLIRNCFDRVKSEYNIKDIYVSTNTEYAALTLQELPELSEDNLILEPAEAGRAVAFAFITITLEKKYDSVVALASDEYVEDVDTFKHILQVGHTLNVKHQNHFFIIGMNPSYAAPGYGYIEIGNEYVTNEGVRACTVVSFKEKPSVSLAKAFIAKRNYLWNTAMYIFNPKYISEKYKEYLPVIYEKVLSCQNIDPYSQEFIERCHDCEKVPFETTILEQILNEVLVIPTDIGWSDMGGWKAIRNFFIKQKHDKNHFDGNVVSHLTEGTYVYVKDKKKLVTLLGLKNIIVVDTGDSLLIADAHKTEEVKKLLESVDDEFK